MAKYIPKSEYLSKNPEKRARQLANLKRGRKPGSLKEIKQQFKKLQELNIMEFSTDPNYLNLSFKDRPAQAVILKTLYGLELDKEEQKIFNTLTKGKGKYKPEEIKTEAILALGGRSGKSFLTSVCALYEATRDNWKKYVSKGEYVFIVVVATRELQARQIIQTNCLRMLENSPVLKKMIAKSTDLEITLTNNIKIISGPANSTALRGIPIAVLILDECAFFFQSGPKADYEIFNALRPRQSQFPDNKLFMISTCGAKTGLFFDFFNEGFKVQDRLTCQASTSFMNPLIPKKFLEKEKARDISNFKREFLAEFSEKMESFFTYELIQRPFTLAGDIPYKEGFTYYLGFDQSGLSGNDRFGCSIGHVEKEKVVIDCVRSWQTKSLDTILNEIERLKKEYHLTRGWVDRYAVGYIKNLFQRIGLIVEIRPSLAEIYVTMKSLIMQDRLSLPDREDLKAGMRNTLALYGKSNQLTIFHERGEFGHADALDSCVTVSHAICNSFIEEIDNTIVHYEGPGMIWTEDKTKAKTFNFLHRITPEEEKEEQEDISNLF